MNLLIYILPLFMISAVSTSEEKIDCFWIADFFSKRICTGWLTKDLQISHEQPHLKNGTNYTVWQAVDSPDRYFISFHNPKRFSCEQYNFYTQECVVKTNNNKKKRKIGLLRSLINSTVFCYKEEIPDMADLLSNCFEHNSMTEREDKANVHSVFHYPKHMNPPKVTPKVEELSIWDMIPEKREIAIVAGVCYMLLAIRSLP